MSLLDVDGGSSILSLLDAGWRSSGRILINRKRGVINGGCLTITCPLRIFFSPFEHLNLSSSTAFDLPCSDSVIY